MGVHSIEGTYIEQKIKKKAEEDGLKTIYKQRERRELDHIIPSSAKKELTAQCRDVLAFFGYLQKSDPNGNYYDPSFDESEVGYRKANEATLDYYVKNREKVDREVVLDCTKANTPKEIEEPYSKFIGV